ncbi:MAG TPA: hypothetical protein DEH78_04525 [Solibacterales bacterium]|nr:hypothetical protein [Bryobacterales bacterium]
MPRALISPRVMTKARLLSERAMPDQVTVHRPGEPTSNGRGGVIPGTPITATYACRYRDLSGEEKEDEGLIRAGAAAAIAVPLSADVVETDEVLLTLNGVADPEPWAVVYAPAPSTYSADRTVGLKRGR